MSKGAAVAAETRRIPETTLAHFIPAKTLEIMVFLTRSPFHFGFSTCLARPLLNYFQREENRGVWLSRWERRLS